MVTINGQAQDVVGMTVEDYLRENGFTQGRVALELNGHVMSSSLFSLYRFKEGDRVEIVHFVGGG